MKMRAFVLATMIAGGAMALTEPAVSAQGPAQAGAEAVLFTDNYGALYYYKTTQEPFDVAAAAATSKDVQSASPFDRAKKQAAEEDRIRKGLDSVGGDRLLTTMVDGSIGPYDPARKEFSIDLFEPGRYVEFRAYGRAFQLAFDNADAYASLKLPEAEARKVNDKTFPRSVAVKVDFRLVGAGDPTGTVGSSNTVRAMVTKVRLLAGGKQIGPDMVAASQPAAAPVSQAKSATDWTVQGLHLGMTKEAFEAAARTAYSGAAKFELGNEGACGGPYRAVDGYTAVPGTVCVTYTADQANMIKQFTVKQLTANSPDANDGFRKLLTDKFGAVAYRENNGGFGWGELVGPRTAQNYTVYATSYGAKTSAQSTSGISSGIPGLVITITDPDFARAQLPATKSSGAASPKL